ncbi:TPA: hypothetical protein ACRNME_005928, partial [Pseudomonas aeruginosa]
RAMEGMVVWLVRERRGEKKGTKRDSGRQCTISSKKASEYRRKRNRPGLGAQEKLPIGTLAEFCSPAGYRDIRPGLVPTLD